MEGSNGGGGSNRDGEGKTEKMMKMPVMIDLDEF